MFVLMCVIFSKYIVVKCVNCDDCTGEKNNMGDPVEQDPDGLDSAKRTPRKPEKSSASRGLSLFSRVAQPVTLPAHLRKSLTLSAMYSPLCRNTYMEQCFEDVKYLAEGSYGIVFEAKSKDDGKWYAVKQFKKRFTSKMQRNLRLEEIHRYASLPQNQFCVELIRAWEEDAYLFVQMELCSVNLKQFMAKNSFIDEDMLWKILLDLLLAVQHLHSNHFIHLDIKPENVLISPDNVFKLADFGLMLDLSKGPVYDADEGDSRYLAPEVLRGVYTKAADIFSLGISMLEVGASLQLPSRGHMWQELRCGILPNYKLSCCSKELFDLIQIMMSPVPGDRPSADKLLKYKKLAKMHRSSCLQAFLQEMVAKMKSLCAFGKIVAVNCGLSVIKPFASRVCQIPWKKEDKSLEMDSSSQSDCLQPQSLPRQQAITSTPGIPKDNTEGDIILFRARLAACRKRLNFDEEGSDSNSETFQPASANRSVWFCKDVSVILLVQLEFYS